jgi:hypothetical protein
VVQDIAYQRRFIQKMLEIIKNQQYLLTGQVIQKGLLQIAPRWQVDPQRSGEGGQELVNGAQLGQGDKDRAIVEPVLQYPGQLDGKAGLADPAAPQDGNQPDRGILNELEHPVKIGLAPHEGHEPDRKGLGGMCAHMLLVETWPRNSV